MYPPLPRPSMTALQPQPDVDVDEQGVRRIQEDDVIRPAAARPSRTSATRCDVMIGLRREVRASTLRQGGEHVLDPAKRGEHATRLVRHVDDFVPLARRHLLQRFDIADGDEIARWVTAG